MKKSNLTLLLCFSLSLSLFFPACNTGNTKQEDKTSQPEAATAAAKPVKAPEARGSKRILFIGNSHTEYYVSIPDLFLELCRFNHKDIKIDKVVEMGISLRDIYQDHKDKVTAACSGTDPDGNFYDYVVLQEKTPVAANNAAEYKASVKQYLAEIRKNSPGAVFLVYEVMSPASFDKEKNDYQELYKEMKQTAQAITGENENTRLYRVSDAITDAYAGKHNYVHLDAGRDRLRFGDNTLHLLNDGGFMAAVLLYATLFDTMPELPGQMPFSTGTGDNDMPKMQPIKTAVSNLDALQKIAWDNK